MRHLGTSALLFLGILPGFALGADVTAPADHPPGPQDIGAATLQQLGRASLRFEANEGQTASHVSFLARGDGYTVFITPAETLFVRGGTAGADGVVRMTFPGADPGALAVGSEQLAERVNYYKGQDPERWVRGAPTFARVECPEIYPGVDLVYRGTEDQLAYDFVVAPGISPEVIRLSFEGVTGIELDAAGNLLLRTAHGTSVHRAPVVYQEGTGGRQPLPGRFVFRGSGEVGFEVRGHDPDRPLVIDPTVVFARQMGGGADDGFEDILVNAQGDLLVLGGTNSVDFPTAGNALAGARDVLVMCIDHTSGTPLWTTYLGGGGIDGAAGLATDSTAGILVCGGTWSIDFPTTLNALQPTHGGSTNDGFLARLDASGALVYATYLGGSGNDGADSLAIGLSDRVYLAGYTASPNLPTTAGAYAEQPTGYSARGEGFLAVFAFSGSLENPNYSIEYLTYLGGGGSDRCRGIAVTGDGHAYLTGDTTNHIDRPPLFPTTAGSFLPTVPLIPNTFLMSGFVARLNPAGNGADDLVYSTLLPIGNGFRSANAIAADEFGRAYVTGVTGPGGDLPTTSGAFDESYNGGKRRKADDGFVIVLDTDEIGAAGLVYGSYVGGYHQEAPLAIATAGASESVLGDVYVAGVLLHDYALDDPKDKEKLPFPVTEDALAAEELGGWSDGFLTHLHPAGQGAADLVYSTLIGGSEAEQVVGLTVDPTGRVYLGGNTTSTDFVPILNMTYAGGSQDAFVMAIDFEGPLAPTALQATAVSSSAIDLEWADNANNEDGFEVERSSIGSPWSPVATLPVDSTDHTDLSLVAETEYFYRVRAFNTAGVSGDSNIASATTQSGGGSGIALATGEIPVAGTVSGIYQNTWFADDDYESVTERESGGKPSNRYSYLVHKWTFEVPPGSWATLHVMAHHSQSSDNDPFLFAYSTDDSLYTDAITVTQTMGGVEQSAALVQPVSGTVYIRVMTETRQGHRELDTLFVNHIRIEYQ